ncbi:MAG: helix-turn-helix domain-containing protein [Lachnospiraceae bacterium]|nr:helix-turn-helix domain-containing protein [Lachnospiraceae bacterium]
MTLGQRIRKIRRDLDLTQTEFATRIGSVQNTVTGYETGRKNPSSPVISLICKEFHVNEEWLRNGTGEMFLPDASDEIEALVRKYHLSNGIQIFIEKLVNSRPEAQDAVINLITETAAAITASETPQNYRVTEDHSAINIDLDNVAAAEAAYEQAFGIQSGTESQISNTTGGIPEQQKA